MKCKRCQDAGELFMPGKFIKCPDCQPITNDEYIRNCSIKERAKLLYRIGFLSDITGDVIHIAIMQDIEIEKAFELWLKQPHTPKE